jgi:putative cell wall-binding protein
MQDNTLGALGIVIVVPTRNRADLAVLAVRSAVQQEGPVTVVVSDNSTDPEQSRSLEAECAALAASTGRPLHYLQPGQDLPMPEHWEWARLRAQVL